MDSNANSFLQLMPVPFTFGAAPEDGEMAYVGPEPVLLEQGVPQGQERGFRGLYGGAALLTDQVVVVTLFGGVIAKSTAPQVGLGYQAHFLQQLQVAIDGGNIHLGIYGADMGMYILSAYVVIALLEGGQDELALWGHPVALLP